MKYHTNKCEYIFTVLHDFFSFRFPHFFLHFQNSLLRLDPPDLNKMALECFACIMRYMGDLPLLKNQHEVHIKFLNLVNAWEFALHWSFFLQVDCVNTVLMYCHKFDVIRDEVYCQVKVDQKNLPRTHIFPTYNFIFLKKITR